MITAWSVTGGKAWRELIKSLSRYSNEVSGSTPDIGAYVGCLPLPWCESIRIWVVQLGSVSWAGTHPKAQHGSMKTNDMKDNKLIAEFMGFKLPDPSNPDSLYSRDVKRKGTPILDMNTGRRSHIIVNDKVLFEGSELKFHTSWDWLIPVVHEVQEREQVFAYDQTELIDELDSSLRELNLDNVYKAVVEFIKWSNAKGKP